MSTEMGFDASTTDISNHLPGPHLTRSWHAFSCAAHHEPPLAAAAHSGLKPPPAGRSRRATQPPSLVQHRSQQTRHHSSDPIPRSCSQAPPPLQGHRRYYEPVRRRAPRRYSAPRRFSGLARSLSRPPHRGRSVSTRLPAFRTQAADRARATCTPGTAWPVNGYPPGSSRDRIGHPGSDASF